VKYRAKKTLWLHRAKILPGEIFDYSEKVAEDLAERVGEAVAEKAIAEEPDKMKKFVAMNSNEIRNYAKENNVVIPVGIKKAEMIDILMAAEAKQKVISHDESKGV
jgi:hypothetical protein